MWNCRLVMAAEVTDTEEDGSCDLSMRSQTSIPPSIFPTTTTPGREGDHAPQVSKAEAKGEENSGEETPSCKKNMQPWKYV